MGNRTSEVTMVCLAILLVCRGVCSAEPWRAVEQPELKQALQRAPVLPTESLGEPSRGVLAWKHALVPNPDGKTCGPKPEIYWDQMDPDTDNVATLWYRLPADAAKAPENPSPDAKPEDLGWKSLRVQRVETYPYRLDPLALLPDGRLYSAGEYGYSASFVYDPKSGKGTLLGRTGLGPYTHIVHDGILYVSGYPGGMTSVYDPKRPWTLYKGDPVHPAPRPEDAASNPRLTGFEPTTRVAINHGSAVGADGKIYFGGFGERSYTGGGLGWYDPKTEKLDGFWRPLSGYTVHWIAPALAGRLIVISTSRAADELSNNQAPEEAKLFVYDVANGKMVRQIVPIAKGRTTGLIAEAAPGRLLGLTTEREHADSSILYGVDVATGDVLFRKALPWPVSTDAYWPHWVDPSYEYENLTRGPDGFVWTYLKDVLVRIDPKDARVHVVGKVAPVGYPTFVGKDIYLSGPEQLRRIRNIVPGASKADSLGSVGTGGGHLRKPRRPGTDYFPPPESQGGWRKLDEPEDIRRLGRMEPQKLTELRQWLLDSDDRNFAAVVIRNGYIVLEVERGNSAKTDARRVASVSKAVCATVLAIACEQSRRGLTPKPMTFDDPAFQFIPWAQPLSDPRKAKITVEQLLNHTSGICPEATGAPNDGSWDYILGHTGDPRTAKLAFDPGTACGYSTHALAHAALVCETVTGKPYDQFAIEALFKPLGIEHWWFQFYDGGEKYGRHPSHGLGMPARDLARIAYCMAHGGRWRDRQVIPQWFIDQTAAPTHNVQGQEMRFKLNAQTFSHGWELPARLTGEGGRSGKGIPQDARFKPGSGGQLIALVPSLDLVVTRQTGSSGQWAYEEYLRRACAATIEERFSIAPLAKDNYLLFDQAGIDAAKRKAETQPWAKAALDAILGRANRDVKRPVTLPPRGGQWWHWYSCKKDGTRLVTDSPASHRCRVCGTVYHGDPYDAVVFYHDHLGWSHTIRALGLAYRFTGRKEYAEKAGEILVAYADRYANYPLHDKDGREKVGGGHIMAQTLDESVWLIPVAFGYALVRETLPAPARTHIENDLLVAAADVIRGHKMGIHNIQCWKNSAVGVAGFAANNEALVREAIDDPQRGFRVQVAKGITDDGLWYEGSMGYHRYTMDALWPLAEAARLSGVDLYSDRFRSMFDAPLMLALPDGESPGFNDNSGGNVRSAAPLYELAYARWKRPEYGRLAAHSDRRSLQSLLYGEEKLPAGPFIPTASVIMRDAGFAMLRAGGNAVAIRFGKHGGGHGHPDKLNIVTYAAGHLFGLDPGSINYGVPLHGQWYRATIAHNTVAVDGKNQSSADGELEQWSENSFAARLSAAYPGVTLRRALSIDGSTLKDRYECSSEAEHDYDYAFHAPGEFSTSLELKPGEPLRYMHIEKVSQAHTDGDWWAEWQQGGSRYRLSVKGVSGTVVYTGVGPGRDPADRVPLVIVRRHAKQTVYDCTHEFGVK